MTGFTIGIVRLITVFVFPEPGCDKGNDFFKFDYLYFAFCLFTLCFVLMLVISYFTEPPSKENLFRLTYWTRNEIHPYTKIDDDQVLKDLQETKQEKIIAGVATGVCVVVCLFLLIFFGF